MMRCRILRSDPPVPLKGRLRLKKHYGKIRPSESKFLMKRVALSLIIIFLLSCKDKVSIQSKITFNSFVFSQASESSNYSIKFGNSDTIFYQKRFSSPKENFYSVVRNEDLKILDSFLKAINFSKLDTCYIESGLQDGLAYKFFLTKDSITEWSFIYGDEGPSTLYKFASWLKELKNTRSFDRIDSTIDFGNLRYIEIPNVPPPKPGD